MKSVVIALVVSVLLFTASCKKACYQCTQYCAYCVQHADSSVAYKICANKSTVYLRVDSVMYALRDSGYVCNLLRNQRDVCDGENSIKDAVSYYLQEDYFCNAK